MTTKVRMSVIENQKTDLQTALQIQSSQLNSYLGKLQDSPVLIKTDIQVQQMIPSYDSFCNVAFANRNELKMAFQKEAMTKSRLNVIKAQNNPSLSFLANGGFKNGSLNTAFEDVGKLNFAIDVGFKVPLFDANR